MTNQERMLGQIDSNIERFSFECRKVIGFALSTRCDWLKRFAPPFHPIRSKTKANCDALARFSRALRQPHVITSSFDWFNVLSVSYVIGQSNYFGFGFTTLKRKPLYTSVFIFRTIANLSSAFLFIGHMTVSTYTCAIKFALSRLEEIGVGVPFPNLTPKNTLFLA